MNKSKIANKIKQKNGITLIALVITIIVLLILAGVAISAISGNENSMEKAQQAKTEKEKGDELDTIKLAVVDAVAMGSDGQVSLTNLKKALLKIPDVVSSSDVNSLSGEAPWTVAGKKASYEVASNGTVTKLEGLSIAGSLTIVEGTVQEITVRKYGETAGKEVSWSKEGNVTFVTDSTGATVVAGTPTGNTVYVKAGAKSSGATGKITVSATGEESKSCNITIKTDLVTIGTAINADKYGYKVTGYDVKLSEVECWRLFYQDEENTYIIANKPQGSYKPSDYYGASGETRYTTGKSVSGVGKGLNSIYYAAYPEKFILNEITNNMRAVAWMTDTTNIFWTQYKDSTGNAEWAIASPTIDLLVASYNAVKEDIDARIAGGETGITARTALTVPTACSNGSGYICVWNSFNTLPSSFNHGLYNNGSNDWWLASPSSNNYSGSRKTCLFVDYVRQSIGETNANADIKAVRPIVCIPTTTFNSAVEAGTYTLTDE